MYLSNPRGLLSRASTRLKQNQFADVADNVNLEHGTWQPWPEACPACELDFEPQTIITDVPDCDCFAFDTKRRWIKYPFGECDWYIFIQNGVLRMADKDDLCAGISCKVCPSCPLSPLTGIPSSICDDSAKNYVYTYVNKYGMEGPPSPVYQGRVGSNGQIQVSGFSAPPADECIVTIRLYRLDEGFQDGETAPQDVSDYFLIAELPPNVQNYTDNISMLSSEIPLLTQRHYPAPENLVDVAMLPTGALAVASGRTIYISESPLFGPRINAFTREHDLSLRSTVKALVNDDNGLFVATDEYPALISWQATQSGGGYSLTEVEQRFPILAPDSFRALGGIAYYVAAQGIIALTRGSRSSGPNAQNLTVSQWTHSQFKKIVDENTVGVAVDGKYFFTSPDNGGSVYVIYYGATGEQHPQELTGTSRITFLGRPNDMQVNKAGVIIYQSGDGMSEWDLSKDPCDGTCFECSGCTPVYYETPALVENSQRNYGAIKAAFTDCGGGGVKVSLYSHECNERYLIHSLTITDCQPYRLPKGWRATDFKIVIETCDILESLHLAATIGDLTSNPGGVKQ